jgi:hypothetical protein
MAKRREGARKPVQTTVPCRPEGARGPAMLHTLLTANSRLTAEFQTANVAYLQIKVQLSGFSAYPDFSPSQLFRISGVLLYIRILHFENKSTMNYLNWKLSFRLPTSSASIFLLIVITRVFGNYLHSETSASNIGLIFFVWTHMKLRKRRLSMGMRRLRYQLHRTRRTTSKQTNKQTKE